MANKTRELILDAFITLARRNPQRTSFTMTEIAAEAGISRQAIYQKHFNNFEDIIDYIHKETDQQIFNIFNNYCPERDGDPITLLADRVLPLIYEKREVIGALYNSQADPCWKEFLRGTYSEWVLKKNLELHSRFFLLSPFKGIDHYLKFFIGKRDSFAHFGMVRTPRTNIKLCWCSIKANAI